MATKPEAFDYPPTRFDTKHWGYHEIKDKCPRPVSTVVDDMTIRGHAKTKLTAYLSPQTEWANLEPLKDFETFDPAERLPGTVVEFDREMFAPDPDEQDSKWKEPYKSSHLWGVVCNLPTAEGTTRAIVPFIDFPEPGSSILEPSAIIEGPIRHGAVYHTGTDNRPSLTKITTIRVHANIF